MRKTFLPYGRQNIRQQDIEAVVEVLQSDFLTTGPRTDEFQSSLSRSFDSPYAVACSSGTSALHLAYLALDLGPDDVVIVPSITFVASANAARLCGADVVFADTDPKTGLMELEHLQEALSRVPRDKTAKAVCVVFLRGVTPQMEKIYKFCQKNNLYLIEDACHAIGTTYGSDAAKVGSCQYSDMACFSFHPVKTIAMGEGGAVLTANPDFAHKMQMLVTHGITRKPEQFSAKNLAFDSTTGAPNFWYYEQRVLGLNYRASDIHCALGLSQLNSLSEFSETRKELMDIYLHELDGVSFVESVQDHAFSDPVYHLMSVHMDFKSLGKTRHQVMLEFKDLNIGTQVHYIPVHQQPYYQSLYGEFDLPGAQSYYQSTLSLPLHTTMTAKDVNDVIDALKSIVF